MSLSPILRPMCALPTPSAAAELVSPDRQEWLQRISQLRLRLHTLVAQNLAEQRRSLQVLQQRLGRRHPGRRLQDQAQRLDEWEQRLQRAMQARLERSRQRLQTLSRALHAVSPLQVLGRGYAVIRRYPERRVDPSSSPRPTRRTGRSPVGPRTPTLSCGGS